MNLPEKFLRTEELSDQLKVITLEEFVDYILTYDVAFNDEIIDNVCVYSILIGAVYSENIEIIEFLLEENMVKLNEISPCCDQPILVEILFAVFDHLHDQGNPKPNYSIVNPIINAFLSSEELDINLSGPDGMTALDMACKWNNKEAQQMLIEKGAIANCYELTPWGPKLKKEK
ncbi:hypothetical protein [Algivirga pacifica]|uniref:Ankyrin repeat domain-containing protein n=1 Tax=Algivirga pacifica TaxID=1162670 RepID=A0ABP9DNB7_9BACT